MFQVYGNGRGGKHRNTDDAARWRFLTAHIARNFWAAHPNTTVDNVIMQSGDIAAHVTYALNRRFRETSEDIMQGGEWA